MWRMWPAQDPEPSDALNRMDKAELEDLQRRTLDELAEIDQGIAAAMADSEAVYTLMEQKAAKELLLSRIGLGATGDCASQATVGRPRCSRHR